MHACMHALGVVLSTQACKHTARDVITMSAECPFNPVINQAAREAQLIAEIILYSL